MVMMGGPIVVRAFLGRAKFRTKPARAQGDVGGYQSGRALCG